jgi:hypothetical protein
VRSDAEIDERVAVLDRVAGDLGLPRRLLLDQLDLERFAALAEEVDGFLPRPQLALVDEILTRKLAHLGFDAIEIVGNERAIHDEIVEEALVDGRTDAAIRCAVECRVISSASGDLPVMTWTFASTFNGKERSTRRSSTFAAIAASASRGEMSRATCTTGVPVST